MKHIFVIISLLSAITSFSQTQIIDSIPKDGIVLNKGWKFHAGDNADWAAKNLDDRKWEKVDLSDYTSYLHHLKNKSIGWLRLNLLIDSTAQKKQIAIQLSQLGASEIYLNGISFQQLGSISSSLNYKSFNSAYKPFLLQPDIKDSVVIAVRFASNVPSKLWLFTRTHKAPLIITINSWDDALAAYHDNLQQIENETKFSYLFVALSLLFILLYIFFPREKLNLLFGIFCFFAVTRSWFMHYLSQGSLDVSQFAFTSYFLELNDAVLGSFNMLIVCYAILKKVPVYFQFAILTIFIDELMLFTSPLSSFFIIFDFISRVVVMTAFFYLSILALKKKNLIIGVVSFIAGLLNLLFFLYFFHVNLEILNTLNLNDFVRYSLTINFIMTTFYVAINFARKSKNLEVQLVEIDKLSKDNLKQEKEKQQILASQNETLEEQVTQRTSQLNQSLQELKSTQAQLIQSEKMASLGELTAGIAHEIQNPLNFVNNFSEVNKEMIAELKDEIDKGNYNDAKIIADDIESNEEKINHHGKRADTIVKGMLQHSRQTKGIKEPTDINALCDEYLRLSYHGLRAKDKSFNADFKMYFDESIGKINIVPQDIGRVLLNLFNNAFYAVNERSQQSTVNSPQPLSNEYKPVVSVSTKKLKDKIEIKVCDNGNGIPQAIIDKIFQPFFTTKPTGEGTGLGLSLAYDIITKEHNGTIRVESKEGEGSKFVVELPT